MEIANDRFLVNGGVKVVGLSTDHRLSLAQSPIDDGAFLGERQMANCYRTRSKYVRSWTSAQYRVSESVRV